MSRKADTRPPVTITYDRQLRTTDKATLLLFDKREVWMPFSQIELNPSTKHDGGEVTLPAWLAEAKELV